MTNTTKQYGIFSYSAFNFEKLQGYFNETHRLLNSNFAAVHASLLTPECSISKNADFYSGDTLLRARRIKQDFKIPETLTNTRHIGAYYDLPRHESSVSLDFDVARNGIAGFLDRRVLLLTINSPNISTNERIFSSLKSLKGLQPSPYETSWDYSSKFKPEKTTQNNSLDVLSLKLA